MRTHSLGLVRTVLALAFATAVLPGAAVAAPADLDTTFGSGGTVTVDFASSTTESATSLAVQTGGKLVAAGSVGDQYGNPAGFALARLNPNGSLDSSFGGGGKVTTDFPSFDYEVVNALIVQPDGKLVAAGSVSSYATGEVFALARYNSDGSLDSSFGSSGLVSTSFSTYTYGGATGLALQADGKLVVTGTVDNFGRVFGVARYNADGNLDGTFGPGGLATAPFYYWESANARAVAVQPDGRIVVGGTAGAQFVLARFNTDGTLDGTFGSGGIARPTYGYAYALGLQTDGKIVEAGTDGTGFPFQVARVHADGTPDTTFAGSGATTVSFSPTAVYAAVEGVQVQTDGKIVLAGTGSGDQTYFALARFNPDGTLDTGFSGGGTVLTTFPSMIGQSAHALALQTDGAIVAAGTVNVPDGSKLFGLARYLGDSGSSAIPVSIDIKPGSATNPIRLSSGGLIPVAILTTDTFDATTVDPSGVCFGDEDDLSQRDCTEAHGEGHIEDVNGDGRPDLLLYYEVSQTGIDPGDTRACLSGKTFGA